MPEEIAEDAQDAMKNRFLLFLIGEDTFGVEIRKVMEIVGIQSITRVPEMPDYMKGLINLRGIIIPVMDVRLRLKKAEREYNDRTCVIIIRLGNRSVGLIVDGVSEVMTIPEEDITDQAEIVSGGRGVVKSIGKIDRKVVLLINCEKLLSGEELAEISAAL